MSFKAYEGQKINNLMWLQIVGYIMYMRAFIHFLAYDKFLDCHEQAIFSVLKIGHFSQWKWFKQAHCVSYSMNNDTILFYHLTGEDSRHYVLANLLN